MAPTHALGRPLLGKDLHASPASSLGLAATVAAYLASGVSQPLLMTAVRFAGLGDTSCQLYIVPYYVGMSCVGLLTLCGRERTRWSSLPLHRSAGIALVGLVAQSLNWSGNMLAGSAVFAVVYASVTIWAALLSRLLLGRALSATQWGAVVAVFVGLGLTGMGATADGHQVVLGAGMVCVGAALHALCHVLSEWASTHSRVRIPPHVNCCTQGLTNGAVICLWQSVFTASHWERIANPMDEAGTTWAYAGSLLAALAVSNLVHAGTFFHMLTELGVVTTGVLKGLQAVLVVGVSHVMFCHRDASQCFTPFKGASLVVVVSAVVTYTLATAKL